MLGFHHDADRWLQKYGFFLPSTSTTNSSFSQQTILSSTAGTISWRQ
jgi:hypothetical protein